VQLHDCVGSRRACACPEAGFSRQNGDRTRAYCWRAALYCDFCGKTDPTQRIFINKYFLSTVGSVCRVKRFTMGREFLSRTFESRRWCTRESPCWNCDRRRCEAGGRAHADRRIMTSSVATGLVCSHDLAYSIINDFEAQESVHTTRGGGGQITEGS
jgi:hypothetical protein